MLPVVREPLWLRDPKLPSRERSEGLIGRGTTGDETVEFDLISPTTCPPRRDAGVKPLTSSRRAHSGKSPNARPLVYTAPGITAGSMRSADITDDVGDCVGS